MCDYTPGRGEALVVCLRPFIEPLAGSGLSPKTIRRRVDNVWLLGSEVIRDLHQDPSLRKLAAEKLLSKVIHEDGGPLIHNGSEEDQRIVDSACHKLQPLPEAGSTLTAPVTHRFPGRGVKQDDLSRSLALLAVFPLEFVQIINLALDLALVL